MPLGPQPRRARGTIGHPYSALNLRLALAAFGLVACAILAGVAFGLRYPALGAILAVLAAVALADLVVIQLRWRARRRTDPERHSLFE
jgi:hypothetical protein